MSDLNAGNDFSGATRLLGLIGDPVLQARTPGMANRALEQSGRLGSHVLVPMHVAPSHLASFVDGIRLMQNFAGAVVTMPHKIKMASLIDELSPEAQVVGAVNVIRRKANGELAGTVLDGEGFVSGLRSAGHAVAGKTFVLVGAGGAAAAIAYALGKYGAASICLLNRTPSRATLLAQKLREAFPNLAISTSLADDSPVDIAINGTSLGMKANDPLPMAESLIERATLVAECVVAPEVTPLLELARRKGRIVHSGVPMLSSQISLLLRFMGVDVAK